jgi:hypothetical protein
MTPEERAVARKKWHERRDHQEQSSTEPQTSQPSP